MKIDLFDRKILSLMQKNCRISVRVLSESVGLSASATQRRVNRLREIGAIEREVAIVNQSIIDTEIILIVDISLSGESYQQSQEFRKNLSEHENVKHCYFVTGQKDYVVIFSARTMESYEQFMVDYLFDNPIVHNFSSRTVIKTLKESLELQILN